jgi:hypothetical protein
MLNERTSVANKRRFMKQASVEPGKRPVILAERVLFSVNFRA